MRRAIRRLHVQLLALVLGFLAGDSTRLGAVEICGNGINDDPSEDSLMDEGCNPEGYLRVRESPLPGSTVGIVAPITGQQIWTEPPDLDIKVAFGPALQFIRSYNSQIHEGDLSALPIGWRHNYSTWITTPEFGNWASVRMLSGSEVLFILQSKIGDIETYAAQAGHHEGSLSRNVSTGVWTLRTHAGWSYAYSGSATSQYLDTITDPQGYALTITRSGAVINKVTAATGAKELRFYYSLWQQYYIRLTRVEYWANGVLRTTLAFPNDEHLGSASLDGANFRNYQYDGAGKLSRISDASNHTIAEFVYASTAGKTVLTKSGAGFVGYKYGDSTCSGGAGVYQYFNLKDDGGSNEGIACDTDLQCGSGYYCGGQRTPGTDTTGLCFRARRCVTTVPANEDLVAAVSSSCPTCTDVAQRSWDTTALRLKGEKDAENVWTSYLYNSNGYVTKMVENDTDDDATIAPSGARVTWFFYSSTFPALVTEVRRLSELKPLGTCDNTTTTDCKRTITTYTTGARVNTVQEIGFTYNLNGNVTSYSFTTDYDYDAQGRLTQVNGPRTDTADDIIQYTYWSGAGNLQDGYLKEVKRQKTAGTFITMTYDGYDYWGNPGLVFDANSKLTCLAYDATRNVLTTTRVTMANQTSCTADPSDLVTTYTYDSGLNLTTVQLPGGNCTHYEYDARGRALKVKSRDDCNAASAGDTQEFTYDDDGQLIKTEYKDPGGTVTKRQEMTYAEDGRVKEILNPADTAKKKTLTYKPDGMLESITGENLIGKTEWAYDNFNRTDTEKRYNTSSTSDDWNLTPGVQLDLPTSVLVEADGNKHIDWVWDDMGRKVKQVTPDAGTTILVYDEAGNLTDRRDAQGTADEMTHHFGFDALNRVRGENWGEPACFTEGGVEVQHFYDDQPSCPEQNSPCINSIGRLAKVRTKIRCDISQPDHVFDQWTYYNYDAAGRLAKESIRDDGGRVADIYYEYDKNGNVTKTTAPSGFYQKSVYGSAGNNADRDKLVEVDRGTGSTQTVLTDSGTWVPFGPMKQYRQSNTISGNKVIARFTWDLAYRPTEILYEEETSGTDLFRIAYALDAQGRVTVRDFTGGHSSLLDSYFTYDWQNRVVCDAAVSGACPTSGTNLKTNLNSSPPYTASSDRRSIKHKNLSAWPLDTFTYNLVGGTDQIASITKGNGQVISFGWDNRGNRLYDDDADFADDRRDFVYDSRDNLISVSGKMKISDTVVHNYTASNAYDDRNRRIFKSILDTTAIPNVEAQYFYYYDLQNRLIEVKYTPNIADSGIYEIWQLYWIGNRPVAIFESSYIDENPPTVAKRYFHSDELGTPLEMYSWPNSGDTTRVWAYNPDAFGWGDILAGAVRYQPLRFPGQLCDEETTSVYFDTASATYKSLRPPLSDNRNRVYDPFVGAYLQSDPRVGTSWNSYAYAANSPTRRTDATGLLDQGEDGSTGGPGGPSKYDDTWWGVWNFQGWSDWVESSAYSGREYNGPPGRWHSITYPGTPAEPWDPPGHGSGGPGWGEAGTNVPPTRPPADGKSPGGGIGSPIDIHEIWRMPIACGLYLERDMLDCSQQKCQSPASMGPVEVIDLYRWCITLDGMTISADPLDCMRQVSPSAVTLYECLAAKCRPEVSEYFRECESGPTD